MSICPVLSSAQRKVNCISNECAWWCEAVGYKLPLPDCAVHAFPYIVGQLKADFEITGAQVISRDRILEKILQTRAEAQEAVGTKGKKN